MGTPVLINDSDVKAKLAQFQMKLRVLGLIFNLPNEIQKTKNIIEFNSQSKEKFAKAQEGGSI